MDRGERPVHGQQEGSACDGRCRSKMEIPWKYRAYRNSDNPGGVANAARRNGFRRSAWLGVGADARSRDRPAGPDESAAVVPRGLVQVETGYLLARDDGVDVFECPARSFASALERAASYGSGTRASSAARGATGRATVRSAPRSIWIETADGWTPELAILGGLSLPTGDEAFSSDGVDPSFLVAFAHELSPRLSLGYNVGAAWESSPDQPDREASLLYSLALGMGVTGSTRCVSRGVRRSTDDR